MGHGGQRALAQRIRARRRRRRTRRERPHRARDLPDPAHRARLPRAGIEPRRAVRSRDQSPAPRVLRRSGRLGRPRRHLPCARRRHRRRHRRARVQRWRVRRQGGHGQPDARRARRLAARPAGEVHAVARGELPHPRQAPSRAPRVLGRLRRRRSAHRRASARRRRLGRLRLRRHEGARAGRRPRHRPVPRPGRRRGVDRRRAPTTCCAEPSAASVPTRRSSPWTA